MFIIINIKGIFIILLICFVFIEYFEFIKILNNVIVKVGIIVRFDCLVKGEFKLKIVWNKNGGNFLVVNENRFYVMIADDVFFIV